MQTPVSGSCGVPADSVRPATWHAPAVSRCMHPAIQLAAVWLHDARFTLSAQVATLSPSFWEPTQIVPQCRSSTCNTASEIVNMKCPLFKKFQQLMWVHRDVAAACRWSWVVRTCRPSTASSAGGGPPLAPALSFLCASPGSLFHAPPQHDDGVIVASFPSTE